MIYKEMGGVQHFEGRTGRDGWNKTGAKKAAF
jgi:hypothetical protein